MAPLYQMLGRLESGQVLNRQMADQRVTALQLHMDARLSDLSHSVHGRIDRVEREVDTIKAIQAAQASVKSPGERPWWRDVTPKEALTWIATGATLLAVIMDPSRVDKLMAYVLK